MRAVCAAAFCALCFFLSLADACSPRLGWQPKTDAELMAEAKLVFAGTVLEIGGSYTCHRQSVFEVIEKAPEQSDVVAVIAVDCLYKGGLECATGSFGGGCTVVVDGFGSSAACKSEVEESGQYLFFVGPPQTESACDGVYSAYYGDILAAAKPVPPKDDSCTPIPPGQTWGVPDYGDFPLYGDPEDAAVNENGRRLLQAVTARQNPQAF